VFSYAELVNWLNLIAITLIQDRIAVVLVYCHEGVDNIAMILSCFRLTVHQEMTTTRLTFNKRFLTVDMDSPLPHSQSEGVAMGAGVMRSTPNYGDLNAPIFTAVKRQTVCD
jgi:hypothetical protein